MTGRATGVAWLILLLAAAGVAEIFFATAAFEPDVAAALHEPSRAHLFGTDSLGRDLLARLLIGAKTSLFVGVFGSLFAVALGAAVGIFAGWRGGWCDRLIMRFIDLLLAIPSFALVAVLTLGLQAALPLETEALRVVVGLVLGVGLTHWMSVARVVRAQVLSAKTLPFVGAARAMGATDFYILRRHIFPAVAAPVWVLLGLQVPASILYESFMSFIGVGVQPPQTSWGMLIQEGWTMLATSPHLMLFPTLVLFLTVWSLHLIFEKRNSFTVEPAIDTKRHSGQTHDS